MIQHWIPGYYPPQEDTCQRVTIVYDSGTYGLGRPYSYTWGGSSCPSLGNRTFTESFAYTPAGQVTQKTVAVYQWQLTATYTYDSEGKVVTVQPPSGATDPALTYTYSFDSMDRPIKMVDSQSTPMTWVSGVTYNAADQMTQMTRPSGTYNGNITTGTEQRQYNSLSQLSKIIFGYTNWEYIFSSTNNNGRITQLWDHFNNWQTNYTYDTLNRLSSASGTLFNQLGAVTTPMMVLGT